MTRTHDLLITNQLLYQLSYTSICENRLSPSKFCLLVYHVFARLKIPDLNYNRRPHDYESGALPAELIQHRRKSPAAPADLRFAKTGRDNALPFNASVIITYFFSAVNTKSARRAPFSRRRAGLITVCIAAFSASGRKFVILAKFSPIFLFSSFFTEKRRKMIGRFSPEIRRFYT